MSLHLRARHAAPARTGRYLGAIAVAAIAVVVAGWLFTLLHAPADSGSLDARATAVGATVRCPVCKEPIPVNDEQNMPAMQMRQFIRQELQQGLSEDQVRQLLVQRYGPDILLAPPQQGFDLLAWLVPLAALAACACGVLLALRRWSRVGPTEPVWPAAPPDPSGSPGPEARRYEEQLDRELWSRE